MAFSEIRHVVEAAKDAGIEKKPRRKLIESTTKPIRIKESRKVGGFLDVEHLRHFMDLLERGAISDGEQGRRDVVGIGNLLRSLEIHFEAILNELTKSKNGNFFVGSVVGRLKEEAVLSEEERNMFNLTVKLLEQAFYRGAFLDLKSEDTATLVFLVNRLAKIKEITGDLWKKAKLDEEKLVGFVFRDHEGDKGLENLMNSVETFAHSLFSPAHIMEIDVAADQVKASIAEIEGEQNGLAGPELKEEILAIEEQIVVVTKKLESYYNEKKFETYFHELVERMSLLSRTLRLKCEYAGDVRTPLEIIVDGQKNVQVFAEVVAALNRAEKNSGDVVKNYMEKKLQSRDDEKKLLLISIMSKDSFGIDWGAIWRVHDVLHTVITYLEGDMSLAEARLKEIDERINVHEKRPAIKVKGFQNLGILPIVRNKSDSIERKMCEKEIQVGRAALATLYEVADSELQGTLKEYVELNDELRGLEQKKMACATTLVECPGFKDVKARLKIEQKELLRLEAIRQKFVERKKEVMSVLDVSKKAIVQSIRRTSGGDLYFLKVVLVALDQYHKRPASQVFDPDSKVPDPETVTYSFITDRKGPEKRFSDVHYLSDHLPFARMTVEYLQFKKKMV